MRTHRRNRQTTLEDAALYDLVTNMETGIIERLSELRKMGKTSICPHFQQLGEKHEQYSCDANYYELFWKLYMMSEVCRHKVTALSAEISEYESDTRKVQEMFQKLNEIREKHNLSKKKSRRKASQIQKAYVCSHQGCSKSYGTELALKFHVKQKHKD